MAYFNHAFNRLFLGTKNATALQDAGPCQPAGCPPSPGCTANPNQSDGTPGEASGFIIAGSYHTSQLIDGSCAGANLGIGSYGFFDPATWTSVNIGNLTALGKVCCPLVLAATALYQRDQLSGQFTGIAPCPPNFHQGGFHGGYQESNKSKVINPKYLSRFYRVDPCVPNQNIIHVGNTPFTENNGIASGVITANTQTYQPNGTHTGVTFTGGTGTGAVATVVVTAGVITSVTFTNPGVNYTAGDVLTPLVGSGTPALAILVGGTPTTVAITLLPSTGCCFEFLCDQSYSLRLDIKGSPALRALNHNAYYETATWTGCCTPNCASCIGDPVDPTIVYIAWATQLLSSPMINPFIQIIVYDQAGTPVGGANDIAAWCAYVSPCPPVVPCDDGTPCTPGTGLPGAGMTIIGAYVDTKFGNCTFYPTDFFEKEPVHIYASMVDYTGDVCAFTGICVSESCCPRQGNGFGDTVLKDLILSERYQQNDFYTGRDLRIREITQGYDISNAVNRASFYTRYYILHSVPRFNNPSGVFDNDQYLLEIITNGIDTNLEAFMSAWTLGCAPCPPMEIYSCGDICCAPLVPTFATVGTAYTYQIVTPGTCPTTFSNAGAIGVSGLTLSVNGVISGTPLVAGVYEITTTAIDANGMVVACFDVQIVVLA